MQWFSNDKDEGPPAPSTQHRRRAGETDGKSSAPRGDARDSMKAPARNDKPVRTWSALVPLIGDYETVGMQIDHLNELET